MGAGCTACKQPATPPLWPDCLTWARLRMYVPNIDTTLAYRMRCSSGGSRTRNYFVSKQEGAAIGCITQASSPRTVAARSPSCTRSAHSAIKHHQTAHLQKGLCQREPPQKGAGAPPGGWAPAQS